MAKKDKAAKSSTKSTSIDLMSIFGFLVAIVLIVFSIMFVSASKDGSTPSSIDVDAIKDFFDVPSILITIGGTVAGLMVAFPASYFTRIGKHMKIIFRPVKYNAKAYIEQIVEFATSARIDGILSLEKKLTDVTEPFLKSSLMLVVDSVDPEKVRQLLDTELEYLEDRHSQDRKFYEKGAAFAPAFGMIGTLIGLVKMLSNMAELGSDGIGPAMSVALITTFYGTLMANLIFSPIANKLRIRHEEEYLCKTIIVEGVEAIQAGENPRYIEEKLMMLVPTPPQKKQKKEKAEKK